MAEIGVAAAVVGILGFGVQVCEGLWDHYSAYKDQDETVAKMLNSAALLKATCKILHSTTTDLEGKPFPKESVDNVKKSVENCNDDLSRLKKKLDKLKEYQTPTVKGFKGWLARTGKSLYPFRESTLIKLREIIDESVGNLELALETLNLQVTLQKFEEVRKQVEKVGRNVEAVADIVRDIRTEYASEQQTIRHQKILDWLSPNNPFKAHEIARRERSLHTGKWFLRSQEFRDWTSRKSPFLCLHGTSGCGKTVLCSTIIEQVAKSCEGDPRSALGYFYFNFQHVHRHPKDLLQALLLQFALKLTDPNVYLDDLYSKSKEGLSDPQIEDVEEALKNLVNTCTSAYIVVDALDECQDRDLMRTTLERMIGWTSVGESGGGKLSLLLMTRPDEDLKMQLNEMGLKNHYTPVDSDKIDKDISSFVDARLTADQRLRDWPELNKSEIKRKLTENSKGMFRWVVCQIRVIRECISPGQLSEALESMPKDLYETYERDLLNIGKLTREAVKILHWLAFSARPLRLKELCEVIAFDEIDGHQKFDKNNRPLKPRYLLRICPSLITMDAGELPDSGDDEQNDSLTHSDDSDGEVRLAHFSVKNYLTSAEIQTSRASEFSMREPSAHPLMAEVCLTYLLQFGQHHLALPKVLREFPLTPYASRYWYHHASLIPDDAHWKGLRPLIRKLLNDKENFFTNWLQVSNPDRAQPRVYRRRRNDARGSPLYYASLLGLFEIVSDMLNVSDETDIDAQGGSFGNALQAACAQGNTKVVELLLDKGAVVDNECGFFGTALQAACYDGQKEIVDLLLSKNCNIDIEGGNFGSALQAASLQGHEHIVRTLLAKEAKVNSTGGEYWTALQAAASQVSSSLGFATETYISDARPLTSYAKTSPRHLSICKLLLKQKANVNAQHGGNHDTALEAAAYSGGEEIVQLLLEHKAEINGQAGDRHNPLQAAAYRGHSDIVQLLLRKGATIDDGEGVYGNALQAASFRNHASIVRDLLECQPPASISLKSRDGETALHWAAMFGDVELVKTLLTKGSNPVEPDAHGWTPVLLAWMYQRGSDAQKLIVDAAAKYSSEDFVGLPPTRLVKALECSGMSIEEDGVTASLEKPNYEDLASGAQLRSDHPFTANAGCQYFEVTILKAGPRRTIGIGLCDKMASRGAMPGWNSRQWAYHADDGMTYAESGAGRRYSHEWGEGDVVGCGVDVGPGGTGTIFFMKNGQYLREAFRGVKGRLFPVIGTREKETKVKVEFGIPIKEIWDDKRGIKTYQLASLRQPLDVAREEATGTLRGQQC